MPLPDVFGVSGQQPSSPPSSGSSLPDVFGTSTPSTPAPGHLPDVFGNMEQDGGGFSLFGFLGNVAGEAKGMVQGVTSLIGAGVHDVATAVQEGVTLGQADTGGYKLDDIAKALPGALAQDYNSRYGVSKFAEGDIWGGLKAIFTGLYEHPLSAIGDALMVGGAVKLGAKAGLLGDVANEASLGAKVLGPGSMEAMSLTGGTEAMQLGLSQNPVARLAQQKLYDVISYGNGLSDRAATKLGYADAAGYAEHLAEFDAGAANRAAANLAKAVNADNPLTIIRPGVSRVIENRGISRTLSLLNLNVGDRANEASVALRRILEERDAEGAQLVDHEAFVSGSMGTKATALPDQIPSNAPAAGFVPANDLNVPDIAELPAPIKATPGLDRTWVDTAAEFKGDLIRLEPSQRFKVLSPHDMVGEEANRAVLVTTDMNDAANMAQRYADTVGGRVIAKKNYFGVSAGDGASYDGIHYFVETPEGVIHDVSIATPDLLESQRAWSHIAEQADAKAAEIQALKQELAIATSDGQIMHLQQDLANAADELGAIQGFNSNTFDYTRRVLNGGDYDPTLAALDRARNVIYNHSTREEIGHGLTFRKALDRSFGALRAEKWSSLMRTIEEGLTARIQAGLEAGMSKEELVTPIITHLESVLGTDNPWIEGLFRSNVPEVIPFETGYTIGGEVAQAAEKAAPAQVAAKVVEKAPDKPVIPPPPSPEVAQEAWSRSFDPAVIADAKAHPDAFSDVDKSIALHKKLGVTEPWNEWEYPRRLAEHRLWDEQHAAPSAPADVVREANSDIPEPAPAPAPEPTMQPSPLRTATFRGRLATGERTILSDERALQASKGYFDDEEQWIDATPAEQAAEIAHRMTLKLRASSHESMVINGEFPGLDWKSLMREQIDGGLPVPQYYPHIKASKATGDVVMMNQHNAQIPSIVESETGRMKKWGGWLYERGTYERDPIKAYESMFRQVQRHVEFRDTMQTLINKYGREVKDPELAAWGTRMQGEVLVSQKGLNGMIDSRTKLITMTHDGVMGGKSLEDASLDALGTLTDQALASWESQVAGDVIYALPRHVAMQIKRAAKLQLPGTFNFYYDTAMGLWKSSVLSLSPRWVVNNTLGNLVYMGVHNPGAIRYFIAQLMPKNAARAKAILGEGFNSAIERDFMHGEMTLSPAERFAARAERGGIESGMRLAQSPLQDIRPVRALRSVSSGVRTLNTYIEDAARRGVALNELRKANVLRGGGRFLSTKSLLEDIASHGFENRANFGHAITEVNKTLGDYLTMSPVESQIIRRFIMPFYAFYRHTAKFIARMPFEHPLKGEVLRQIAEVDRQMNPYMPDYMMGSANIGGLYVRFGGSNPLAAVTDGYWPAVAHPLLGLAVQRATGTNPFGQPWNPPPGATVDTFGGGRYAVLRNGDGQVTGVRQIEGQWEPPLYESILGMLPQAGLIFDPFDRAVAKRFIGMAGVSFSNFNPATEAFYQQKHYLEALKRGVLAPPA